MKQVLKYLPFINLALLLAACITFAAIFSDKANEKPFNYIDSAKLFSEFNMTKDLQAINMPKLEKQKKIVDSLYKEVLKQKNASEEDMQTLQYQFNMAKAQFQNMNNELSQNANNQIWTRLNDYAKEYGEANNVKIILDARNSQSVLYADPAYDITNSLLDFVNAKYEGVK